MPNHCVNNLTLTGTPETIKRLLEIRFDFEQILPAPKDLSGIDILDWRTTTWGTKWNAFDIKILEHGVKGIQARFTTAWAPPVGVFSSLLHMFPDLWLKCEWHEEGGYAGVWVGHGRDPSSGEGPEIRHFEWEDLCLEEVAEAFTKTT